jgi:hypothetical protein
VLASSSTEKLELRDCSTRYWTPPEVASTAVDHETVLVVPAVWVGSTAIDGVLGGALSWVELRIVDGELY